MGEAAVRHVIGVNAEEALHNDGLGRPICPAPAVYRATCSCGWRAPHLTSIDRARSDAIAHQREETGG